MEEVGKGLGDRRWAASDYGCMFYLCVRVFLVSQFVCL